MFKKLTISLILIGSFTITGCAHPIPLNKSGSYVLGYDSHGNPITIRAIGDQ